MKAAQKSRKEQRTVSQRENQSVRQRPRRSTRADSKVRVQKLRNEANPSRLSISIHPEDDQRVVELAPAFYETNPTSSSGTAGEDIGAPRAENYETKPTGRRVDKKRQPHWQCKCLRQNYQTNPCARRASSRFRVQGFDVMKYTLLDARTDRLSTEVSNQTKLVTNYETKPCARSAGSKFRVQGSRLREFCETKPNSKPETRNMELRRQITKRTQPETRNPKRRTPSEPRMSAFGFHLPMTLILHRVSATHVAGVQRVSVVSPGGEEMVARTLCFDSFGDGCLPRACADIAAGAVHLLTVLVMSVRSLTHPLTVATFRSRLFARTDYAKFLNSTRH